MKKVVLLLIDSLMPQDLENIATSGKAPAFNFLMKNGVYKNDCITAFPTMTASVDATLMTGVYPDKHKIPGLIWYHPEEKRIVNYINGAKTVLKLGINTIAKDVLENLNLKHLSKDHKTIFEEIEENGKTAGSINFIIYRGNTSHELKPPFLMNITTMFTFHKKKVKGPNILSIGAIHKPKFRGRKIPWGINQTCIKAYGINDDYAFEVSKTAVASGAQPDFMAIYLPDHDHYLHKHINRPLISLERVDKKIGDLLDCFGSWEKAIEQNTFIIIGDHGQTRIGKDEIKNNIDVDQLLKEFKMEKIGMKIKEDSEVIFANNERMVYIYPLKRDKEDLIINTLLTEDRIDYLAWKSGERVIVQNHLGSRLEFQKEGKYKDFYGKSWDLEGDLALLDIQIVNEHNLEFYQYPDALSRLYGALFAQDEFVITLLAKPSYEFISESFPTHLGGGSHGSMHRTDSIVPLLVAGARTPPSQSLRIVDLKGYILELLNISSTTTG